MSKGQKLNGMLALGPSDASIKENVIVGGFGFIPEYAKKIEQAGKGYASLQGKLMRMKQREQIAAGNATDADGKKIVVEDSEEEEEEEKGSAAREEEFDDSKAQDYEKKRKKKTKSDVEKEALIMGDLYAILGLEDLSYEATENQISKAYKKAAIKNHPDKLGDKITEKDKEIWLKTQNAYETLMDPVRRKKYDSSLPFDDKIPKEDDITEENFYELFSRTFARNARFSTIKPVPELGNKDTSMNEVYAFYRFWDSFKTWREFSQYDEYDTEEAQDRYEKRWMEQQNKRERKKHDKEERKRLINLSNRSYNADPRIKAALLLEEAEKEASKRAKKDIKAKVAREKDEKERLEKEQI